MNILHMSHGRHGVIDYRADAAGSMWTAGACGAGSGNVVLLRGRGFELHDEFGRDSAAAT